MFLEPDFWELAINFVIVVLFLGVRAMVTDFSLEEPGPYITRRAKSVPYPWEKTNGNP